MHIYPSKNFNFYLSKIQNYKKYNLAMQQTSKSK